MSIAYGVEKYRDRFGRLTYRITAGPSGQAGTVRKTTGPRSQAWEAHDDLGALVCTGPTMRECARTLADRAWRQ